MAYFSQSKRLKNENEEDDSYVCTKEIINQYLREAQMIAIWLIEEVILP